MPVGNTRHLPTDWHTQVWNFVLSIVFFVAAHKVPKPLVVNADHTGLHATQQKGGSWQCNNNEEPSVQLECHGNKRQLTAVITTSLGNESHPIEVLPVQLVYSGATVGSLPHLQDIKYELTHWHWGYRGTAKEKQEAELEHVKSSSDGLMPRKKVT